MLKNVRKINGDEYEPDTLSGLQRSIQRFISDGKSPLNILVDKEFAMPRKVLVAKRKNLVQKAGKGNTPNATRAVTDDGEDKLFKYHCLRKPGRGHGSRSTDSFHLSAVFNLH